MNETHRRHQESLTLALGPLAPLLEDERVGEVLVNPNGEIWVDTYDQGIEAVGEALPAEKTQALLRTTAGQLDLVLNQRTPVLEGLMPHWGFRIEGVLPPVAPGPCLAIRKPTTNIFPITDYLQSAEALEKPEPLERPTEDFALSLSWALGARRNVLVVGATSSAKTSFLNSYLQLLADFGSGSERIFVLEDTPEIQCPLANTVQLTTTPDVSLTHLVRIALRMRPDRIFVGEVRGPEALPMLKAWNTGHEGGAATLHANSCLDGLYRLEELIREAGSEPQREMIARSIHFVVFLERTGPSRRSVVEMQHVLGVRDGDYHLLPVERSPSDS